MTFLNPVAEQLTGWSYAEAQGLPFSDAFKLVDETTHAPIENLVECCLRDDQFVKLTQQPALLDRHGKKLSIEGSAAPIRDNQGHTTGAVVIFSDVTEARQLVKRIAHEATHDALTGLVNRREFEKRLDRALASAKEYGGHHVLCYLDLDQFKIVNDTAGHVAGDELLRQIKSPIDERVSRARYVSKTRWRRVRPTARELSSGEGLRDRRRSGCGYPRLSICLGWAHLRDRGERRPGPDHGNRRKPGTAFESSGCCLLHRQGGRAQPCTCWLSRISGKGETILKQAVALPLGIYNNVEPG